MKSFDMEYSTQWLDEFLYLKNCGIRYTFVKEDANGTTVWKYKKTPKLFECLKNFYSNNRYYIDGE